MGVCALCRHDGRQRSVKFWTWEEQADLYTNPPPLSAVKVKSTERWEMMVKMKEWKPILAALSWWLMVGWGWATEQKWEKRKEKQESGVFVGHIPAVSQEAISTLSSDWEGTEEGMKIEEKKNEGQNTKKGFPHSTSAVFPWKPFSQHCRRQERLWSRVRYFWQGCGHTKESQEGIQKERKEKQRKGVAERDKRMSDSG